MKNIISVILAVVTIVSLGYGFLQQSAVSEVTSKLEAANARAMAAEDRAIMQTKMAQEQRAVAEKAMGLAEEARARADQAVIDCQKKKK